MKKIYWFLFLWFAGFFTSYALEPVREYVEHPSNFDMKFKEEVLITEDHCKIQSWICYPEQQVSNNTVLILAYGDTGNMSFWLRQVAEMVKQGFTLVMFDYRGFGASQDFEFEPNRLYYDAFQVDLKAVLEHSKKVFPSSKIGVWALSMGTISATMVYKEAPYDFMVAEGFAVSPQLIIDKLKLYKKVVYSLPEKAVLYEQALSDLNIPLLLFAGDKDGMTTVAENYRVKYLNSKSDLVIFKGGHLQGFQALSGAYHGEKYIGAIQRFLKTVD